MRGLPYLNKWIGAFGEYDIPQSIMWLANEAQRLSGLDSIESRQVPYVKFWEDPGFKVCEEWGTWRDKIEQEKCK